MSGPDAGRGAATSPRPAPAADRGVLVLLSVLLIALTALAPLVAGLSGMRSTGCAGPCRYDAIDAGVAVMVFGPLAAAVAAVVTLLLLRRRVRLLWWVPAAGLLLAMALLVGGDALIGTGITA